MTYSTVSVQINIQTEKAKMRCFSPIFADTFNVPAIQNMQNSTCTRRAGINRPSNGHIPKAHLIRQCASVLLLGSKEHNIPSKYRVV